MRKIIVAMGLLAAVALLGGGTPAKAAVGCGCGKIGQAPVCVANIDQCSKIGGVCLFPCDYQPPVKKMSKSHAKKKKM